MKFVELKEPRYKDMSVLIGKYRLTDEKSILWFSKAKFLKDKRFIIFRNEINNFETEFINNFECIKISLKQLKNISTAEIIRAKYVDSLFYKKLWEMKTIKELNNIDGQILLNKTELSKKPLYIKVNGCLFQIENDTPVTIKTLNHRSYFAINIFDLTIFLSEKLFFIESFIKQIMIENNYSENQIDKYWKTTHKWSINYKLSVRQFNQMNIKTEILNDIKKIESEYGL